MLSAEDVLRDLIATAMRQFETVTGRRVDAVDVVHDPRTDLADAVIMTTVTPSSS